MVCWGTTMNGKTGEWFYLELYFSLEKNATVLNFELFSHGYAWVNLVTHIPTIVEQSACQRLLGGGEVQAPPMVTNDHPDAGAWW